MHAELTVTRGLGAGGRLALKQGDRAILGRGDDATLRLPDEGLSRHHAAVELGPQGLAVTDLGSKNGTRLDGRPLVARQATPSPPEALLELGAHAVALRLALPLVRDEFERLADLGAGGMGRVFAARHRATGQLVAIKALHTPAEEDPVARERFRRESCVRVASPFVVQVQDVRIEGRQVFLVLELVQGPSLEKLLAAGPFDLRRTLEVGAQVALGLDAAHRVGVIHRDVKPGNILLDQASGAAKLGDFGIAKLAGGASLTASGTGLGTMAYVAPEQAEDAKRVSPAADLYALGATLYHALAGRPPFLPGPDLVRQLFEDDPPPLPRLRPDVPLDVAKVVHRMLEKEPDDRPPSAGVVAERLRALRQGLGDPGGTRILRRLEASDHGERSEPEGG